METQIQNRARHASLLMPISQIDEENSEIQRKKSKKIHKLFLNKEENKGNNNCSKMSSNSQIDQLPHYDFSFLKYPNCDELEARINSYLDDLKLEMIDPEQKKLDYFNKKRESIFQYKLHSSDCIFSPVKNAHNNSNCLNQKQNSENTYNYKGSQTQKNSFLAPVSEANNFSFSLRKSSLYRKRSENYTEKISSFSIKDTITTAASSLYNIEDCASSQKSTCNNQEFSQLVLSNENSYKQNAKKRSSEQHQNFQLIQEQEQSFQPNSEPSFKNKIYEIDNNNNNDNESDQSDLDDNEKIQHQSQRTGRSSNNRKHKSLCIKLQENLKEKDMQQ